MNKHLLSPRFVFQGVFFFASLLLLTACTNPKKDLKPKVGMINDNGHDYVDLNLPSGLLWATCNVGAEIPEAYGDYFAWGETKPKSDYSWSTLKYCNDGEGYSFSKYVINSDYGKVDNKTILDYSDDAATANWGGSWRMPTQEEWEELLDERNCKLTWTTQGEFNGYRVTSIRNGKSIFLPAAGYRYDTSLNSAGSYGDYWSSSLSESYPRHACNGFFYSNIRTPGNGCGYRFTGKPVRPVAAP